MTIDPENINSKEASTKGDLEQLREDLQVDLSQLEHRLKADMTGLEDRIADRLDAWGQALFDKMDSLIENTCHWSLDVTFREDASRATDQNLAENLSWLRRFALGLIKQHPDKKTSLVMKRRKCGWSTAFLAEVLFGKRD